MAQIRLKFIPPDEEGITALNVYESAAKESPFTLVETTTEVGTYPNWINEYVATAITNPSWWFSITWVIDGVETDLSSPIKGGTDTLVEQIVNRVRERDSSLNERIVAQEAEGAIQTVYGDSQDPYDADLAATVSYRKLQGLVYLVMARAYIAKAVTSSSGSVQSATMGLVSFKSATNAQSVTKDVQALIDLANRELGISTSFVMLMEDIEEATYQTYDHSRLVSGWVNIE